MSMTRKHYIEFADSIADHINTRKLFEDRQAIWYFAMHDLSQILKRDNPRFAIDTFEARIVKGLNDEIAKELLNRKEV
jgi:hypothetical protein